MADPEDEDQSEEDEEVSEHRTWPRDAAIDSTKEKLVQYFKENRERVYYDQQLRVLFEERPYRVYQWITGKALTELREEGKLQSELLDLQTGKSTVIDLGPGAPTVIRLFWHPRNRFWRHKGKRILKLVRQFSTAEFGRGLGHQ